MAVSLLGLHYILERPDGTLMDPATGQTYPSIANASNELPFYAVGGYTDTGISVALMSAPVIDATVFRQSTRDRLRQARFGGFHELPL
ncbi:MAG: hypothetical protein ABSF15_22005 [Candidatus Sulfotelmatobacter sp.]|jgi:hypothetical protein